MKRPPRALRHQNGVILFIALIVLVAMSLAGIALMRSVDTNVLIAGNLAFRQGTTMSGDWGIEDARNWLSANKDILQTDQPGVTYYWANWQLGKDLIGIGSAADDYDWNDARNLGTDSAGNEVRYVIHRMCDLAGAPSSPAANCMKSAVGAGSGTSGEGQSKTEGDASNQNLPSTGTVFYRVTVRVAGPRNTLSFVQAILN
jgi:type IV pilus assembly protein PilX